MGQVAFVFPGQGAQYPGMGRALSEAFPVSAAIFRAADELRPGTSAQCFDGTEEDLMFTRNTQPCLFTVEMAALAALTQEGIRPDRIAGFSLGELSALAAGGALSFEEGFWLVCLRGEVMQAEAEDIDSGMVAVVKLSDETVEALCAKYEHVYPVNYNCPGQVAVSGLTSELADFMKDVKEAGGRPVPMRVSGGFHSPFMAAAADQFSLALLDAKLVEPSMPVYSDYTGKPYDNDFTNLLTQQIKNPVRWTSIVMDMIEKGVDTFVEVGPGKILAGLIKRIDPNVRILHVEDPDSLKETVEVLRGNN